MTRLLASLDRCNDLYSRKTHVVLSTSSKEAQTLLSVLLLIDQITTESNSTCGTVMKAGIFDVLLRIYVIFPAFSFSAVDGVEHWSALQKACASIIFTISSHPDITGVLDHPVCAIWTDCHPLLPTRKDIPRALISIPNRCVAWNEVPRPCVERRLVIIYICCLWKSDVSIIEILEACADIVEFTR
jgi:hypothetical protein